MLQLQHEGQRAAARSSFMRSFPLSQTQVALAEGLAGAMRPMRRPACCSLSNRSAQSLRLPLALRRHRLARMRLPSTRPARPFARHRPGAPQRRRAWGPPARRSCQPPSAARAWRMLQATAASTLPRLLWPRLTGRWLLSCAPRGLLRAGPPPRRATSGSMHCCARIRS